MTGHHVHAEGQPARLQELYPNGSQNGSPDIYFQDSFPYPIWRDEEMHALLLDAALHTADAIATSGRPVRTGKHVMLRVDLILMNSDSKVLLPLSYDSRQDGAAKMHSVIFPNDLHLSTWALWHNFTFVSHTQQLVTACKPL